MSLSVVILILAFGLFLIIIEMFFIPGTTFVGIIGAIFLIAGIYYSYKDFGALVGTGVFITSIVLSIIITKIGFKRLANSEYTVRESIDSRVNEFDYSFLVEGDEGLSLSDIRPEGYAMVKEQKIIVYSRGEFIENNTPIEVFKISENKVIVKSKTT